MQGREIETNNERDGDKDWCRERERGKEIEGKGGEREVEVEKDRIKNSILGKDMLPWV